MCKNNISLTPFPGEICNPSDLLPEVSQMTGEWRLDYSVSMNGNRNVQTAGKETLTTIPVTPGYSTPLTRPEFIRLPRAGTFCPYSGLSRSKMNELILPSALNNFRPPVASISLRNRNQVKAVRLIVFDSLMAYLRSFRQDVVVVLVICFLTLASSAMGHTPILEAQGLLLSSFVEHSLPAGSPDWDSKVQNPSVSSNQPGVRSNFFPVNQITGETNGAS